nr:hypothetical protein [Tanacetum cinerariifolium]
MRPFVHRRPLLAGAIGAGGVAARMQPAIERRQHQADDSWFHGQAFTSALHSRPPPNVFPDPAPACCAGKMADGVEPRVPPATVIARRR